MNSGEKTTTQLIDSVPVLDPTATPDADQGPHFDEPEGGYDTGVTTQPDYAAFAREATRVALATGGLGSTGELGDGPRDESGRGAKNPPLAYTQAPEVPEGTRVIEVQ